MLWLVFLVLWPLAELFVIIKVAESVGFFWMLLLLAASVPIGLRILRRRGRAAVLRLRQALAAGRNPTEEVLDGAFVLTGGLLLIVPGFITDVIALAFLLRPTRAIARRAASHNPYAAWMNRSLGVVSWGVRGVPRRHGGPGARGYDVDSTAVDIDEPRLDR